MMRQPTGYRPWDPSMFPTPPGSGLPQQPVPSPLPPQIPSPPEGGRPPAGQMGQMPMPGPPGSIGLPPGGVGLPPGPLPPIGGGQMGQMPTPPILPPGELPIRRGLPPGGPGQPPLPGGPPNLNGPGGNIPLIPNGPGGADFGMTQRPPAGNRYAALLQALQQGR
jgi:hypothetical protein